MVRVYSCGESWAVRADLGLGVELSPISIGAPALAHAHAAVVLALPSAARGQAGVTLRTHCR